MEKNCPEMIQLWLNLPLDFVKHEMPEQTLDFTMDSLDTADRCLELFRVEMKECSREEYEENLNYVVLGWGAYVGEAVRRSNPGWEWVFPDPESGELPHLVQEGPGKLGQLTWPPMNLVLARLSSEEKIHVGEVCRQQMEAVRQLFQQVAEHPELLEKPNGAGPQ